MVTQCALETAVQLHPAVAMTLKLPLPPLAEMVALPEESEKLQEAPSWVMVKLWLPMSMVPVRGASPGLAGTA
jgi:hypothetical protein